MLYMCMMYYVLDVGGGGGGIVAVVLEVGCLVLFLLSTYSFLLFSGF